MTTRLQMLRSSTTGTVPAAGTRLAGEVWTNFPDLQLGVIDASKTAQKLIAVRFYSTTANYAVGDFVVQGGKLYFCITASTAGAFNASKWTQVAGLTDIPALYVLPTASTTVLGGVKVDGVTVTIASGVISSAGTVAVSATAPSPVQNGALWYDLVGGQLYTWINDGSSSQWVIAVNQNISGVYLPLGGGTLTGGLNGTSASFSGALTVGGAETLGGALTITKPFVATGDEAIRIAPSSGVAVLRMTATASGLGSYITSYVGANARWGLVLGNSTAETGSGNIGSDFQLNRFSDAGGVIDSPFVITRSNGYAQFLNPLSVGGVASDGSIVISSNANPILWCGDRAGNLKGAYYWNTSVGQMTMLNQTSSSTAVLDTSGNFVISGHGYMPGGGAWGSTSDARIKTVKGDYKHGLEAILKLRPVSYVYKGNDGPPASTLKANDGAEVPAPKSGTQQAAEAGTVFIGLVAQEAETAMPELVSKGEGWIDGKAVTDLRSLDQTPLVFALINAVKELSARIAALEAGAV